MTLTKLYDSLFNYKELKDADIKKGNILDIIDNVTLNGRANIVKSYDIFIEQSNDNIFTKDQEKNMNKVFKTIGVKYSSDTTKALIELKDFLVEILNSLEGLKPLVLDHMPDNIDIEVMSAREMGILGTISTYTSVIFALEDLSLYLLYISDKEKFIYNLKNKEFVKDLVMIKNNYKELRGNTSKLNKDLRKLDEELEVADEDSFNMHANGFNKTFSIGTNGFLGSPIFILQKAWIDFRIERMEAMKAKKALFELKINNLKNKNRDGGDLKIEHAIEYYEERITKYEREIKAFEEDI